LGDEEMRRAMATLFESVMFSRKWAKGFPKYASLLPYLLTFQGAPLGDYRDQFKGSYFTKAKYQWQFQTQGLVLARQAFYHWSHASRPFCFSCFSYWVSCFLPGQPHTVVLLPVLPVYLG
jgi:hypothetical protein